MRPITFHQMAGISLVELLVAMSIFGVLIAAGTPSYRAWMQDSRIRGQAESIAAAIQLARNAAVSTNRAVGLYLVDSLTDACSLSNTGPDWILAGADPSSRCAAPPSRNAEPRILQKSVPTANAGHVAIKSTSGEVDVPILRYGPLGQLVGAPGPVTVDFSPAGTACAHEGGTARCLRLQVSLAGGTRLCDPNVASPADPRRCL